MRGQGPAFEEFVLASTPTLHRTAVLLTGDPHTARDLLQEALLKAWRAWGRVTGDRVAYVRTIVVREFLTQRRRRWHGERPTEELPEQEDTGPGPDLETSLTLADAVRALPPQQRAVVVLRYFHDLTEADTARTLGLAVGTVKSHHSRALAALRVSEHLDDVVAGGKGRPA